MRVGERLRVHVVRLVQYHEEAIESPKIRQNCRGEAPPGLRPSSGGAPSATPAPSMRSFRSSTASKSFSALALTALMASDERGMPMVSWEDQRHFDSRLLSAHLEECYKLSLEESMQARPQVVALCVSSTEDTRSGDVS